MTWYVRLVLAIHRVPCITSSSTLSSGSMIAPIVLPRTALSESRQSLVAHGRMLA